MSLERDATERNNVIVCKSMSKMYALSGARVGYLCASPECIDELRPHNPPWAVSLLGQVAGVEALNDEAYYRQQWTATHELREALASGLTELGCDVLPGVANFVLCHLPPDGPDGAEVIDRARECGLFLRDASSMGSGLGDYAIRVAVKDAATNARMLRIIRGLLPCGRQ